MLKAGAFSLGRVIHSRRSRGWNHALGSEFSMHAVALEVLPPGRRPGDPWQHSGSTHRIALVLPFFFRPPA